VGWNQRFDGNDHLATFLPPGQEYQIEIRYAGHELKGHFRSERRDSPYTWYLERTAEKN